MYSRLALLDDNVIHTSDRNLSAETIASVVITGIVVVFIGLLILIALVWLYGKIFTAISAKAASRKASEQSVCEPEVQEASPAPAPITEDGIGEETAAVIAAAVAAYGSQTGKKLVVRSIRRSASSASGRNAWSAAGLSEATRPF